MHSAAHSVRAPVFALLLLLPAHAAAGAGERFAPQSSAEPPGATQQCWSQAELAFRDGEQTIRKGRVDIAPPERQLAPFEINPATSGRVLRRVNTHGRKLVALTFDLCEQPNERAGYQGRIIDILRRHGVRATFFISGRWFLTHEERAMQLIADPLFEIGNHTWEHRNLQLLSGSALKREIEGAQLGYEQIRERLVARGCAGRELPQRLSLFRFPFGTCHPQSLDAVSGMGLDAIQWDVSSGDPSRGVGARAIVRNVLSAVKPGSIVLFHANGRGWQTAEALEEILAGLKGYRFVTVSELIREGEPVYASACYSVRPGDTDRYARLTRRLKAKPVPVSRNPFLNPFALP